VPSAAEVASEVKLEDTVALENRRDPEKGAYHASLTVNGRELNVAEIPYDELKEALAARYLELLQPSIELIIQLMRDRFARRGCEVGEVVAVSKHFQIWELGLVTNGWPEEFDQVWNAWTHEATRKGLPSKNITLLHRFSTRLNMKNWAKSFDRTVTIRESSWEPQAARTTFRKRRSALPILAGAGAVVAVLALAGILLWRTDKLPLRATAAAAPAATATPTPCTFTLGFAHLAGLMPDRVGVCTDDETHDPISGDAIQHTTKGMLVWRKADNVSAFTDGYQTWAEGPSGVESRLNTEKFAWEK
jgi:hypothetical protein